MSEFLLDGSNWPFVVSLGLMIGIGFLEGATTLLGFGLSSFLDGLIPDFDLDIDIDVDIDADLDMQPGDGVDLGELGSPSALSRLLGWLHVGRVPILVLLVIFLFAFGSGGLLLQSVARNLTGMLLPGVVASAAAFLAAIVFVKATGAGLAKIIPKDETDAVSERSFIGRVARITLGTAKPGQPAQARLHDRHGQSHYVMVEPDGYDEFSAGDDVVIVRGAGATFYAIRNTSGALVDDD